MDKAGKLLGAFLDGGALCIVAQLLLAKRTALLPADGSLLSTLAEPFTLVSLGVVGGLLYLVRAYDKLEEVGGFGAMLPFSGFCVAIAHTVEGARRSGAGTGKAIKAGIGLLLAVIGVGTAGAIVIALAAFVATGLVPAFQTASEAAASAAYAAKSPLAAESLIGAFIVAGLTALLFQAFAIYMDGPPPKVLVLAMLVGGALAASGLIAPLTAFGGEGAGMTAMGAGAAVGATTLVLCAAGNAVPLITVLLVFVSLTILGCTWGLIRARYKDQGAASAEPAEK
jgi:hypothetical protein